MSESPPQSHECSAFALLLAELQELPVPSASKEAFMRLFRSSVGQRIYVSRELLREDRVRAARRMLDAGTETAVVRDRLIALYGISRRRAYVLIKTAREDAANG